ncbi:MAG: S41 family peptidase [Clostridia bacterium]|nr:S41 family peptidase [Clostridia bacterium]MDD4386192.1 S41 family peptidase [Clostridia bacterium]
MENKEKEKLEKEKVNLNKEKLNFDKVKIITNTLTGVFIILISAMIIMAFMTVAKPYLDKEQLVDSNSIYMNRIEEALVKIYSNYVGDVDMETLVEGAISGIAKSTGDPYTRYVSQTEYDSMLTSGTEKYGGLGIHITYDEAANGIMILSVMPGSPALEEGLNAGDVIKQVGDTIVNADNYYNCVDRIKGPENTKVALNIQRGEENFTKEYTRRIVTVNNVESKKLDGNIGYIKILAFENNISQQFKEQYDKFRSENVSAIVLDLRNNPGGLLNEAVTIARSILPKGDIVKLVYKSKEDKVYTCDGKNEIDIPLIVLVNGNSASASEILAGAIKDSGKGTLVGNKTYGKGIVQTIEKVTFQGALSITTSKYYTASGIEIHKNGIVPNVDVSLPEEYKNKNYVPENKDLQLQKALEILKEIK